MWLRDDSQWTCSHGLRQYSTGGEKNRMAGDCDNDSMCVDGFATIMMYEAGMVGCA
jgi:hypothetical protein